jgi:hypothetical protein
MVIVMFKPVRLLALLAFTVVAATGCSKSEPDRKPTFAITGKVLDGTKPIANATVVFHPVGESGVKPRGKTDANGDFVLTTYDGGDGAPAGSYRVTIELWATVSADGGPVNRIPAKYARQESSGFTAEVTAAPTTLQPFVLKK